MPRRSRRRAQSEERLRLPKLPKIKKIRLPNPIDIVGDVGKALKKAAEGAGKVAEKTVKSTLKDLGSLAKIPKQTVAELDRTARRLDRERKRASKTLSKAAKDVVSATKAAARFAERQARAPLDIAKGALHRKNVFDSLWYAATQPLKRTSDNAFRATQESAILAAAAQVAVSAYGGPAGAAAYASWMAYQASGGDLNLAMRVGATQGLVAAATGAIGKLPASQQVVAKAALKAAVAKAQGQGSEEQKRQALGELVSAATAYAGPRNLGQIKGAMATAAIHGAAVAAAGGNSDAIKRAMLSNGGEVLVQGLTDAAAAAKDKLKAEGDAFLAGAFEGEALTKIRNEIEKAKDVSAEIDQALEQGRQAYAAVKTMSDKARTTLEANLDKQVDELRASIDAARAKAAAIRDAAQKQAAQARLLVDKAAKDVLAARDAAVKAGVAAAVAEKEAKQHLDAIQKQAKVSVEALQADTLAQIAAAEQLVQQHLETLADLRARRIEGLLMQEDGVDARALTNDYVLSWSRAEGAGAPTVVVTFAGAGSALGGMLDEIELPTDAGPAASAESPETPVPSVTFAKLRSAYPLERREQLFQRLGGEWPMLGKSEAYKNTCAIRLSLALRDAGVQIPAKYREAIDGQGRPIILKVKTMGEFVKQTFGKSIWSITKIEGKPIALPSFKGIIVYHVAWTNATGHFDIWTGKAFVGAGNLADVANGFEVIIWSLP